MTGAPAKKSDLGVRTVSAMLMLAVAGAALWLGGWWWTIFVLMVGVGVWFEWSTLCLLMYPPGGRRAVWRCSGAVYCGIAAAMLIELRGFPLGIPWVLMVVGAVIGTDVGAYSLGRLLGGPKIAPNISPSKTWAGLIGGILGASLIVQILVMQLTNLNFVDLIAEQPDFAHGSEWDALRIFAWPGGPICLGALIAILAQAGDFFESWMKRRAGVKDSGKLLPGHGGLFDRVDGLLSVLFVTGILFLAARLTGAL